MDLIIPSPTTSEEININTIKPSDFVDISDLDLGGSMATVQRTPDPFI